MRGKEQGQSGNKRIIPLKLLETKKVNHVMVL